MARGSSSFSSRGVKRSSGRARSVPVDVEALSGIVLEHKPFVLEHLVDSQGNWKTKGFINSDGRITPMSNDTKVLSKNIEDAAIEALTKALALEGYTVEKAPGQTTYPDLTIHTPLSKSRVALDVKTTYRHTPERINGFTLGAFSGYFRNTASTKNILYPYSSYSSHLIYGIVYDRTDDPQEVQNYNYIDLAKIPSVARNFEIISQPKYAIAGEFPGSGNTRNIGAVKDLEALRNGNGPFVEYAAEVGLDPETFFEKYWRAYQNKDMLIDKKPVFTNIESFIKAYKRGKIS